MTITAENGPVILLLWFGSVTLGDSGMTINGEQRAAFLKAGESLTLRSAEQSMVYRAEVGRTPA